MESEIERLATRLVHKKMRDGWLVLVHGPRRVGKTTLLRAVREQSDRQVLWLNGESHATHRLLADRSETNYKNVVGANRLVIIDEAQVIPDAGPVLKFLVDQHPQVQFLVSGSATFDILEKSGEPLTGRFRIVNLFPFSADELLRHQGRAGFDATLENRLLFGCYPEIFNLENPDEKQEYLIDLMQSYLLKDLMALDGLRQPAKLLQLLRMIAFQIGQEVSLEEVGRSIGMSKNTVEKYLTALENVFVIKRIHGFSKNLRKEIVKSGRIVFLDNGIRNALTGDFRPLALRTDIGQLWENAMSAERLKWLSIHQPKTETYFWRTYDQQELDWVEANGPTLAAFEFKYAKPAREHIPGGFSKAYPDAPVTWIHRDNYISWLS